MNMVMMSAKEVRCGLPPLCAGKSSDLTSRPLCDHSMARRMKRRRLHLFDAFLNVQVVQQRFGSGTILRRLDFAPQCFLTTMFALSNNVSHDFRHPRPANLVGCCAVVEQAVKERKWQREQNGGKYTSRMGRLDVVLGWGVTKANLAQTRVVGGRSKVKRDGQAWDIP
jgi:hypothetical protein